MYGLYDKARLPDGDVRNTYGFLWCLLTDGNYYTFPGHIFGDEDLDEARYLDAVTLGGKDYVYVMDREAGRILEITRQGDIWSPARHVVPIDAIDNIIAMGASLGVAHGMAKAFAGDGDAKPVLAVIGKVFFIGEKPGMGQTMKLANNMLSATAMAASSEAMVL